MDLMSNRQVYPRDLEPLGMQGDYVALVPTGEIRRIERLAIRPEIKVFPDGISLSANGTSADHRAAELEMPDGWLGQFRMLHPGDDIPDGVTVEVDQGGEMSPLYTTKNARGSYDHTVGSVEADDAGGTNTAAAVETRLTELYVWEGVSGTTPYFTFTETAGGTPTVQDLRFSGYVYKLGAPRSTAPTGEFDRVLGVPIQRIRGS